MPINIEIRRGHLVVPHYWGFLAYTGATYATHVEADPALLSKILKDHEERYEGTDIAPPKELWYYGVKHTDAIAYQMRGIAPLPCVIKHKWVFTDAEAFDDDARTFVLLPGDEVHVHRS